MRTLILAAGAAAFLAASAADANIPLRTERIIGTGLTFPTNIVFAPGQPNLMYITEKRGAIRVYDLETNTLQATPFLDIDPIVTGGTSQSSEQGLLGLTFDPDYQNNGYFYVNYTATSPSGATKVSRFTALSPTQADASSEYLIITYSQPFTNHNGGWIEFGPDGYLYISSGDGGNANDPGNRAQTIVNQKLGKILRLDVTGDDFPADPARNYIIPPSNPFAGPTTGDDEILHYGLRNPWRCSFDRATGDLYIADVGQGSWEEVNWVPNGTVGLNFGWRCMEGNACTGLSGCTCNAPSLTKPVHVYDHGATGGISITGGFVYNGCQIPEAKGTYFFVDYGTNRYWSFKMVDGVKTDFTVQTGKFTPSVNGFTCNTVVAFGEGPDGTLYIADHGTTTNQGWIFKVIRDPAADPLPDCDGDGTPDTCAIAGGAPDLNGNGIPDACEAVPGDFNGDGVVNSADLGILLGAWGDCPEGADPCVGDLNGDGVVNGSDLGLLQALWTN